MSWSVNLELPNRPGQQGRFNPELLPTPSDEDERSATDSSEEEAGAEETGVAINVSNEEKKPAKIVIPSAKQIRKDTIEGIYKLGVLPEFQDYTIVLAYLVDQFFIHDFDFHKVQCEVPWFNQWIINPFNENLLNEELELATRLEASRISERIQFMLHGGICSRTCGRLFGCLCCCIPLCAIACKVCAYFLDLCLSCVWTTLFDWWLGDFIRMYILFYICLFPKWVKMKIEHWLLRGDMFTDEELSIRNIYDSNSYRVANQYACLLFLAILLLLLGACMVIVSYIYLPLHPDQLFVKVESVIGIALLASGCFGLQFFCRCML